MTYNTKYIFVTGGVLSSLGKGLASAAIGSLLESRGLSVTIQKLDPYINVDPGTMNPFQHGEVFVTDDGAETDLDLGHYERFTKAKLGMDNNFTTGKIYDAVINKERRGDYLGGTVQVIPHITDELKTAISALDAPDVDIVITEIGGTVGDIESLPFMEAIRQMRVELGSQHSMFMHLTLVPYIAAAGEVKTKPTQHSVKELRSIGIQPDLLLCRSEQLLSEDERRKIALFTNVPKEAVITALDARDSIYDIPMMLHAEKLDDIVIERLGLQDKATRPADLSDWVEVVDRLVGHRQAAIAGQRHVEVDDLWRSWWGGELPPAEAEQAEFIRRMYDTGVQGVTLLASMMAEPSESEDVWRGRVASREGAEAEQAQAQ